MVQLRSFGEGYTPARKRVFVPGYSGVIARMQETMSGTFAQVSRDSHFLVYKGCKPSMDQATLPSPDTFYQQHPNPRVKTNAANRSNFQFGDERDWGFETLNERTYRIPVKIPPRHSSIIPGGKGGSKEQLDQGYVTALVKVGVAGVKRLELSIRAKIDQRTSGGPMALRKAFKYFDADGSGDIDPDEFYAAMHAFGLEFTEDQVLALFGYYDKDRDGALSYYEFITNVLDSGSQLTPDDHVPQYVSVINVMPKMRTAEADVMKTTVSADSLEEAACKAVFDRYDANQSGEIDVRELQELVRSMGVSLDRESINEAMITLDMNQNGAISFEEFWTWFQGAVASRSTMGGSKSKSQSRPHTSPSGDQLGGVPPLASSFKDSALTSGAGQATLVLWGS